MRIRWISIAVCVAGLFCVSSVRADIVVSSARFDKAYIPALALTSQGDVAKSKVAMVRLHQAWNAFLASYRKEGIGDESWDKGFAAIEKRLREADAVLAIGNPPVDAHNVLEHIRVTLMELRQQHNIDYFLDHQTAFHEPMEEIVLAAKGKTPATLTPQDMALIKRTMPLLESRWNAVRGAQFDPVVFGFDDAQTAKAKQLIESETAAIVALKVALAGNDKALLIQRAMAIKPPFAQLYTAFGEFAP